MLPGQPTRAPGTPVGELLARRPSQPASTSSRPRPSKRPHVPLDILCSESESDAAYTATPPSPKPEEKPKPSAAPHLRLEASASKSDESPSPLKAEFGCQINFDFCRHAVQNSASSPFCLKPGSQPTTCACAKLLVRSGLRCCWCFSLKSDCLCLKNTVERPTQLDMLLAAQVISPLGDGSSLSFSGRGACLSFSRLRLGIFLAQCGQCSFCRFCPGMGT